MQQKLYISIRDFEDLSVENQRVFLEKLNQFRNEFRHYEIQFYWHYNNDRSASPTWRKNILDWNNEAIKSIRSNDYFVLSLSTAEDKTTLSEIPLIHLNGQATIFESHVDFINKNRASNVRYYTLVSKENYEEVTPHLPPLISHKKMSLIEALDDLTVEEKKKVKKMVTHKKTKLFLWLTLLSMILSIAAFTILTVLSLLSSLWIIAPIALFAIAVFTGINAIYNYQQQNKQQNKVVSSEVLNSLSTEKIANALKNEAEPGKPNFPQNWKPRLFSSYVDNIPALTEQIVFSKNNEEKAKWVHKHCQSILRQNEFIFDDQKFLSQFTSEVRPATAIGNNQKNRYLTHQASQDKDYEIGIKYFPKSDHLINQNNTKAINETIKNINQEYGINTAEAIGVINETLVRGSSYKFHDHEELVISQAGIDRILAQEWKKQQFKESILKIFDGVGLSAIEKTFIREISLSLSRWHDPQNKHYHFYFVSVPNTEENRKAWEDWLRWVQEKIDAARPNDFRPIIKHSDQVGEKEFRIGLTIQDNDIDRCLVEFQKKTTEAPESTLSTPVFHNEKEDEKKLSLKEKQKLSPDSTTNFTQ